MQQTPGLIDSVNHEELMPLPTTLVADNPGREESVTAKVARGLDLQLDDAGGEEIGHRNAERLRRPGGKRELVPGNGFLFMILT